MATVTDTAAEVRGSVVLEDVTWDEYEAQIRIIGDRHIRVNYDSGRMEIMSPRRRHGNGSYLLGRMVDTMTYELDITVEAADPVTLKRPDLGKGVEPDKLYHFRDHAVLVQGQREFDFTVDPPPDLIIEVDETSSSVPRMPIFAALCILEVWRLRGENLQFFHLQPDGNYRPADRSRAFPNLSLAEATEFLEQGLQSDNKNVWIRGFVHFVREVLIPRGAERPEDEA